MEIKAYAKINLCLEIVGRRSDGYHDLVSVMQSVSLADTLVFERKDRGLRLDTGCELPADDSNLILRAARAYFETVGESFGVDIKLTKRIPMKAGLGGGSADAAATLNALNRLNRDRLSTDDLCRIGAKIGADVPFCIKGGTQICRGIGEKMTGIENNLKPYVVIVMGEEGISTPYAFASLDKKYGDYSGFEQRAQENLLLLNNCLKNAQTAEIGKGIFNRFEELVASEVPDVYKVKTGLLSSGAFAAQMSGSGPAVFGLFDKEETAQYAAARMRRWGKTAFLCRFQ